MSLLDTLPVLKGIRCTILKLIKSVSPYVHFIKHIFPLSSSTNNDSNLFVFPRVDDLMIGYIDQPLSLQHQGNADLGSSPESIHSGNVPL